MLYLSGFCRKGSSASKRLLSTMASSKAKPCHSKCRNSTYDVIERFAVPEDKVSWTVNWPEYKPVDYTATSVAKGPVWADPDFRARAANAANFPPSKFPPPKYNAMDGKVNRKSHMCVYEVIGGIPRNPVGRTGLIGRGLLGKWGPNHAADPIVSRWKRDVKGQKIVSNGKPVLEFVGIKRKDTLEWAIPGGMVDAGDTVSLTLKKEFGEEAMNSIEATQKEKEEIKKQVEVLFQGGVQIYAGYVDDPRNTDNAWMETVAQSFHDEKGTTVSKVKLQAGDDAGDVAWIQASGNLQLYASHKDFIRMTVDKRGAAW